MDIAATGTVTWVEGSSVLAFGHPFLSMGPVDMPMADAQVLTVLPSVFRSFKFAATGGTLGSISQDRSSGILGTFGAHATVMVPMTVRLSSDDIPTQTFHFEVVHNAMLTPILSAIAIDSVLTTIEKRTGERTLVWKSAITTPDRVIPWNTVFTGLARARGSGGVARAPDELPDGQRIPGPDDHRARRGHPPLGPPPERPGRQRRGRTGAGAAGRRRARQVDLVDFRGSTRRVALEVHVPRSTRRPDP